VLRHAGVEPARPQGLSHRGVSYKTTNRLLGLLVQGGSARHVVLNATTAVMTPGAESTRSDDVGHCLGLGLVVTAAHQWHMHTCFKPVLMGYLAARWA
jgi:hypothetical protein